MIKNQKLRKISVGFMTILFLFAMLSGNRTILANPLPVECTLDIGGLLPSNISVNLQMLEANVSLTIDASKYPVLFEVEFYGSYRFYNPNETVELSVGAPFMMTYFPPDFNFFDHIEPNIEIIANDVEVDYFIYFFNDLSGWEDYINEYQFYRIFAIANVTFEGLTFTNIEYKWNSTILQYDSMRALSLYYDVATGRAWSGNITERVIMNVIGTQPDFYTDYQHGLLSKSCIIEEIPEGRSYSWIWENERIVDYYVGIEYDFSLAKSKLTIYSIIGGILCLGVFIKRKKRKN